MSGKGIERQNKMIPIARKIGTAIGGIQVEVFKAAMAMTPLSTNIYTISDSFQGEKREKVEAAVRASKLPDGVTIIKYYELYNPTPPPKPFVVIGEIDEPGMMRFAIESGAFQYAEMNYDPEELTLYLDRF